MTTSPGETPVTTPEALTVAMPVSVLLQVNVAPLIGAFARSNAEATSVVLPPTLTVAVIGATVTVATSAGGVTSPLSLQAPKVLAAGPLQTPAALRESEVPTGSLPTSRTPTSTEVTPEAAPLVAANTPS